jgi:hypothetical protein
MSDAPQFRPPDAVILPRGWAAGDLGKIQAEFGPTLGGRVYVREQGPMNMVVADLAANPLLWPKGHPAHPEPRHHWFAAARAEAGWVPVEAVPEGYAGHRGRVLLGYLKPDPAGPDPAAELQARRAAYAQFQERIRDHTFARALADAGVIRAEPKE